MTKSSASLKIAARNRAIQMALSIDAELASPRGRALLVAAHVERIVSEQR